MSYKNDSELVILNRYEKINGDVKALLFETYDRIRDLTVSGPTIGGSGLGKFSSFLINAARMFGSSAFQPILGNESINIPGTSYYAPITGGTGQTAGGQAAFGLSPFSQTAGFVSGGAAPINASGFSWGKLGFGRLFGLGSGATNAIAPLPTTLSGIGSYAGGTVAGGAGGIAAIAAAGGAVTGATAGAGFGRNWVVPAAGIVSGIGGLLTTLGPYFGPFGLAGAAAGSILNGLSGAVLGSFQRVGQQVLVNADTILNAKVRNLEATSKMMEAQIEVVKKMVKDGLDGDKKLLEDLR
jgi:hypothetical protein